MKQNQYYQHAIQAILNSHKNQLQPLMEKIYCLKKIDKVIKQTIAIELASHIEIADFDGKTLVIIADSSAWATRIRYISSELLRLVNENADFPHFQAIKIIVQPKAQVAKAEKPKILSLSKENQRLLEETAANINDDDLKNSLLKIASHGESL